MPEQLIALLNTANDKIALFIITPLIGTVGLYLSLIFRGIQLRRLCQGAATIFCKQQHKQGSISHFQAISAVLAGNLGTGNISGMAVSLSLGGPGALLWMCVMALLGAVLKFAGCVLAVRYRRRNRQGTFIGGPMYYLAEGARSPGLAWAFAAFGVATAFTVGNVVQVNSLVLPLEQAGLPPLAVGLILAVAVGSVIVGGTQRIAHVVALVVPFMALLYLGAALLILIKHSEQLPDALGLVLRSSIALPSVAGGVTGYGIARAVSIGFERGVFATDAGAGIAPILQASAETDCPVTEGIVAMTAPIFVLLICTMTTLVLLVTGADQVPGLQSTTMCTWAFQHGLDHPWGGHLVTLSLTFFAYTTILAWAFCAARCVEYLWNRRAIRLFHCLFVLAVPLGALARVELVWACADLAMAGMLLCNIAGICLLRKEVQAEYSDYLAKEALERDTA